MKRVHNLECTRENAQKSIIRDNENTSHFGDLMTSLMHM